MVELASAMHQPQSNSVLAATLSQPVTIVPLGATDPVMPFDLAELVGQATTHEEEDWSPASQAALA